jgi:starch synthase (maltosyl-transferring)
MSGPTTIARTQGKPAAKAAKPAKAATAREGKAFQRILYDPQGTGPGTADALAFTAICIAPYGPAGGVARGFSDPAALDTVKRQSRYDGGLIVDLPWRCHRQGGGLAAERPDWFGGGGRTDGIQPVMDPRRGGAESSLMLDSANDEMAAEQGAWFGRWAGRLAEAGATGLRLSGLHMAPDAFVTGFIDTAHRAAPQIELYGDTIGGDALAARRLLEAGFNHVLDSVRWADERSGWAFEQRRQLAGRTIGFPLQPGVETATVATAADAEAFLTRVVRTAFFSAGVILPAAALEHLPEDVTERLVSLFDLLEDRPWLAEAGPLAAAGVDGLVRAPTDLRIATEALILAPQDDRSSARQRLGGAFHLGEALLTVGDRAAYAATREAKTRRPAARREDKTKLVNLAESRIAIEDPYPLIDGGRFPAKRIVGDRLEIGADIFCDGHDKLRAQAVVTEPGCQPATVALSPRGNDRWTGRFTLSAMGRTTIRIEAWRDRFASWQDEISKKRAAGKDIGLELIEGRDLVRRQFDRVGRERGNKDLKARVAALGDELDRAGDDREALRRVLENPLLRDFMRDHGERTDLTVYPAELSITVDRQQARFSAWYELFPRSQSGSAERHGTLDDVIGRLPYIRDLGFDVLYFPPIHPIGKTNRKGRNNSLTAEEGDVGSPYAIGSADGGHDALHPELGDFADFERLIAAAHEHGLEIALDFAIQCSPDHPWLREHPEWFDWRPDGTIKFAENPPKRYEDIVNVHFYGEALPSLWYALRDVVLFWCEKGVRMFRVDNPHTKPYPFWEWMIGAVKDVYPDALFLSEAFTRPKVMKRLAKLGFTQSYTYYTWRNTRAELETYLRELIAPDMRDVMNPNFFVNTPDINPGVLQSCNRTAHVARTILAGTLASSYGIYNGIEISESTPLPGKEEYLDSEKYQIRVWDMDRPGHLKDEIRRLNAWRAHHPALQDHTTVSFLSSSNDQVIWYAKRTADRRDYLLFGVTFDYLAEQQAAVEVPLWEFGLPDGGGIDATDLVSGADFRFEGKTQHITLGPDRPFAAFQLHAPPGFAEPEDKVQFADPEVDA